MLVMHMWGHAADMATPRATRNRHGGEAQPLVNAGLYKAG
jgi:hypothetical protein